MLWTTAHLETLDPPALGDREVRFAFVALDGEPSGDERALLDDDERRRAARFVRQGDAHRFTKAHAALRLLLARCLRAKPADVRYEPVPGKPRLIGASGPLEFNLSHSGALALIAVARERPVGVDVELVRELADLEAIAEGHFAPAEVQALRALPPEQRLTGFFRCWTGKEAVIKATGEGLARPLGSFDVDLTDPGGPALLRMDGRPGAEAGLRLQGLAAPAGAVAAGAELHRTGRPSTWRPLVGADGRTGAGAPLVGQSREPPDQRRAS